MYVYEIKIYKHVIVFQTWRPCPTDHHDHPLVTWFGPWEEMLLRPVKERQVLRCGKAMVKIPGKIVVIYGGTHGDSNVDLPWGKQWVNIQKTVEEQNMV